MNAEELLGRAAGALFERAKLRDTGQERSMKRSVAMFNNMVGGDQRLSEAEGWMFMCCLKLARGAGGKHNLDDALDLAGYAALWGECISTEEGPQPPEHATEAILDALREELDDGVYKSVPLAEESTKYPSLNCPACNRNATAVMLKSPIGYYAVCCTVHRGGCGTVTGWVTDRRAALALYKRSGVQA